MVKDGSTLQVTRQNTPEPKVLFYKNDGTVKVGAPFLEDVTVELEKIADKKAKKVVVGRFRAKSRHRRKVGHRQPISMVKIKSITEVTKKATKPVTNAQTKADRAPEEGGN